MNKNTSISLGSYFNKFIQNRLMSGRYKNASEVIRFLHERMDLKNRIND